MIVTEEITDVADFMVSLLGTDCSGDAELTYLTLRVFLFVSLLIVAHILLCFCWWRKEINHLSLFSSLTGYWKHGCSNGES